MAERSLLALSRLTGLSRRELECLDDAVLQEVLTAEPGEELLWRLRRVRRLRRHLGLDYEAIEIIVRLIERVEALEGRRSRTSVTVRVVSE